MLIVHNSTDWRCWYRYWVKGTYTWPYELLEVRGNGH